MLYDGDEEFAVFQIFPQTSGKVEAKLTHLRMRQTVAHAHWSTNIPQSEKKEIMLNVFVQIFTPLLIFV